ncbi:hypothetical protein QJQ45_009415 [Haematococcus lacustris]|nr:hypothetical protein QJQ45_009415 [Haematococcus lacustris]
MVSDRRRYSNMTDNPGNGGPSAGAEPPANTPSEPDMLDKLLEAARTNPQLRAKFNAVVETFSGGSKAPDDHPNDDNPEDTPGGNMEEGEMDERPRYVGGDEDYILELEAQQLQIQAENEALRQACNGEPRATPFPFARDTCVLPMAGAGGRITFTDPDGSAIPQPEVTPHGLPDAIKAQLDSLLAEYSDVFTPLTGLPPDRPVGHTIPLEPGNRPPATPMYRLGKPEHDELKQQIHDLLAKGMIEPSSSPYAAPVLFGQKKSGELRMCIDYRQLNKITLRDQYPLPRIDDLFDKLSGCKVFSSLDLQAGYHQIRITPEDVPKTAFRTPEGHFQFKVLCFGLTNAPATFQRVMNDAFATVLGKCALVYLDDILVMSRSVQDHLLHLKQVFELLRKNKLYAKLSKYPLSRIVHDSPESASVCAVTTRRQAKLSLEGGGAREAGLRAAAPAAISAKSPLALSQFEKDTTCVEAMLDPIGSETPVTQDETAQYPAAPAAPMGLSDQLNLGYQQDPAFTANADHSGMYQDTDGLWRISGKDLVVVPNVPELREHILHEMHDAAYAGHVGMTKTLERVTRVFWWNTVRADVRDYVGTCDACQRDKSSNSKPGGLLRPLTVPGYRPQSDGQTERYNRVLEEMLRHYISPTQADWPDHLALAEFAVNNSWQESIHSTPFFLNTGQSPVTPGLRDLPDGGRCPSAHAFATWWKEGVAHARRHMADAQARYKRHADTGLKDVEFEVGAQVLLSTRNLRIKTGKARKFVPRYVGPFVVEAKINANAYRLTLPANMSRLHPVFHVSLLKKYSGSDVGIMPPPVEWMDETPVYYDERLLDHRYVRAGKAGEFLVQWEGYDASFNTWEPRANLTGCDKLLAEYNAIHCLNSTHRRALAFCDDLERHCERCRLDVASTLPAFLTGAARNTWYPSIKESYAALYADVPDWPYLRAAFCEYTGDDLRDDCNVARTKLLDGAIKMSAGMLLGQYITEFRNNLLFAGNDSMCQPLLAMVFTRGLSSALQPAVLKDLAQFKNPTLSQAMEAAKQAQRNVVMLSTTTPTKGAGTSGVHAVQASSALGGEAHPGRRGSKPPVSGGAGKRPRHDELWSKKPLLPGQYCFKCNHPGHLTNHPCPFRHFTAIEARRRSGYAHPPEGAKKPGQAKSKPPSESGASESDQEPEPQPPPKASRPRDQGMRRGVRSARIATNR